MQPKIERTALRYSPIEINKGQNLLRHAEDYPRLIDGINETLQNAIDENARTIWIYVDYRKRILTVQDNGDGASIEKFDRTLVSVCDALQQVTKTSNKLGRWRIGFWWFMNKCQRAWFTSTPSTSAKGYHQYEFDVQAMIRQKELEIPNGPVANMRYVGFEGVPGNQDIVVPWRSELRIEGFTSDPFINELSVAMIAQEAHAHFGKTMLDKKITIEVEIIDAKGVSEKRTITPRDFDGQPLELYSRDAKYAGHFTARIYVANKEKGRRNGQVYIADPRSDYRIAFNDFVKAIRGYEWLSAECITALIGSGVFEGEMTADAIKLFKNRKEFQGDRAMQSFCEAINTWYCDVGQRYVNDAREVQREQRYQDLGVRVLTAVRELVKQNTRLQECIKKIKFGSIGRGHTQYDNSRRTQEQGSLAATPGILRRHSVATVSKPPSRPAKKSQEETPDYEEAVSSGASESAPKKNQQAYTVAGPEGKPRKIVRDESLGIQLAYAMKASSRNLYDFDTKTGLLTFNVLHEHWIECEPDDYALMRLQEYVAVEALVLQSLPPEWHAVCTEGFKEFLKPYVFMLLNADRLTGRKATKKSDSKIKS